MEFFKKRSTAWIMFAMTVAFCLMIGISNKPKTDSSSIETLPSGVYVQDNANILSDSTEKYITRLNNGLVSRVSAEVQVITIDTANGENLFDMAMDYADELYLSGNCAVFIVAVDDVDAVIVQGNDLYNAPKGLFSDDNLSGLLQSSFSVEDFQSRNLDSDVKLAFGRLIDMYGSYYQVSIPGMDNIQKEYTSRSTDSVAIMIFAFVLFVIIILIITVILTRPRRRRVTRPVVTTGRGYYPPRNTYTTPSRNNTSTHRGGSFSSSTRTSSRSGGFSSSSRSSSSSFSSRSSSSRSGGFSSGSSRGGGFSSGGSRGGGFRK